MNSVIAPSFNDWRHTFLIGDKIETMSFFRALLSEKLDQPHCYWDFVIVGSIGLNCCDLWNKTGGTRLIEFAQIGNFVGL